MSARSKSDPARIRVAELFAGVGGFRAGLERAATEGQVIDVVFSNQWEPSRKRQHASDVYVARYGHEGHVNKDIADIPTKEIPDHDLLVGGFPCQDYSVASTLRNSQGLVGKKGVLWWQIHRILSEKRRKPHYLLLENVDRLLGSPAHQRGRDFAVMLSSLASLGYAVEWRVINAADYGMPQRRKRVFILGHHRRSATYAAFSKATGRDRALTDGLLAKAFPCAAGGAPKEYALEKELADISAHFTYNGAGRPFETSGSMVGHKVFTMRTEPVYDGPRTVLKDILVPERKVPEAFRIAPEEVEKWRYLKGAKREKRKDPSSGHEYHYAEGAMPFPEPLDRPSRTIITGEGGRTPSRFKHVVYKKGRGYRRLVPVELERLNMFPDGHTEGASDNWRAFFMGNALVVGVVERIGRELLKEMGGKPAKKRTRK